MTPNRARNDSSPAARLLVVGLVVAAFISIGGVIATIAGNGFTPQLSDPGAVGGFVGTLVQIAGLAIALAAGVVAATPSVGSRAATPPTTSPAGPRAGS